MIRIVEWFGNTDGVTQILCAEWDTAEKLMTLIHAGARESQTPFRGVFPETEILNYGFEPCELCVLAIRWVVVGNFGFHDARKQIISRAVWSLYTCKTDVFSLSTIPENIGILRVPNASGRVRDKRVNDLFDTMGLADELTWLNDSRRWSAGVCDGAPHEVFVYQKEPFGSIIGLPDMATHPGLAGYQFVLFFGHRRQKIEDVSLLFAYWLHPEAKHEG